MTRWIVLSAIPLLTTGPDDDRDAKAYTDDLMRVADLDRPVPGAAGEAS